MTRRKKTQADARTSITAGKPSPAACGKSVSQTNSDAELELVRLQIAALRTPSLKPLVIPALIGAVPTVALTLVTVWITLQSGILDSRQANLEAQRALLTMQTTDLEKQRRQYESEAAGLKSAIADLEADLERRKQLKAAESRLVEESGVHLRVVPGTGEYDIEVNPQVGSGWNALDDLGVFARAWPKREKVFSDILQLSNITRFDVRFVLMDSAALAELENAKLTGEVRLHDTGLTDERISALPVWRSVKKLALTSQNFTNPARLAGFESLSHLDLSHTPINDAGFLNLMPLSEQLTELDLSGTHVTDTTAHLLGFWEKLTVLSVKNCNITESGFSSLRSSKSLKCVQVTSRMMSMEKLASLNKDSTGCIFLATE